MLKLMVEREEVAYMTDNMSLISPEGWLLFLEEAGMLPPTTDIEWGVTDTLMYVRYEHADMDNLPHERKYLWEPEDE